MLPIRVRVYTNPELNERLNLRLIKESSRFGPWVWKLRWRAANEFRDMNLQFFPLACALMGTEVFVIHLTRDPRGYLFSMQKNLTPKWPMERVVGKWVSTHSTVHGYKSLPGVDYLNVRYEGLCREPQAELTRIFAFLGVDEEEVLQTLRDGSVEHHLIGNRMLRSFDGTIRLDTPWCESISPNQQAEVIARCGSWVETFGYD